MAKIITMFHASGLKVGWMTQIIWVTFLVSKAGLIRKLNYLDVTQMSHAL